MPRVLMLLSGVQLTDLALTLLAVTRYGPTVEANPLVGWVLTLGFGGLLAWKCALLAIILAAASLNPRRQRVLLGGGFLAGIVGTASGLVALA